MASKITKPARMSAADRERLEDAKYALTLSAWGARMMNMPHNQAREVVRALSGKDEK